MKKNALALPLLAGLALGPAWASGVTDALDRPAVRTRAAAHSVLLAVTSAGKRLVAVGERGIVILSDDAGKTWRQAKVPTSVSLTAVEFPSARKGWAVGHAGVVLHTEDGGETWSRQLDGAAAAKLALDTAEAKQADRRTGAAAPKLLAEAQRLVADGPDKPFLALHFESETTGFVVGAYNLIFRTEDGGKSWKSWLDRVDNPKGLHLYAIGAVGKALYLAGEQGLLLRSSDGGNSFQRLATPYGGTYFNLAATRSGDLVLAGLRGNAYRTTDQGKTFTRIDAPVPISFSATATLPDGTLLLANQAGMLFESRDGGRSLRSLPSRLPPVAGLAPLEDGSVVAVGHAGAVKILLTGIVPGTRAGGLR
ncbi:MAG: hypothetical protein HY900_10365 [Deltaproteobacteria bacterium]|nr:hypothetical protein [Deltaproteobacteria bacterium]